MFVIAATIVRWVDDHQPGIVECKFPDRFGQDWFFHEKLPIVSVEPLDRQSAYPRPCAIACQVIARGRDGQGREIAEVDTEAPWGISSVDGASRFHVLVDQLTELDGR